MSEASAASAADAARQGATGTTAGAATMRGITVSREYGSGGGEIARRLAERLGWQLVDHEVVAQVAQRLGVSLEDAEAYDERTEGTVDRILTAFRALQPMPYGSPEGEAPLLPQHFTSAIRQIILGAVASGQVVIVGRGGQAILRDRRDVLHVRIIAPLEPRIAYVMRREQLDRAAAQRRIQRKDTDRQHYMQEVHHIRVDDAHNYDLVLNTGTLSLDSCVNLICSALDDKAARLSLPAERLGPGAGVSPYPARPHDLPVPDKPEQSQSP